MRGAPADDVIDVPERDDEDPVRSEGLSPFEMDDYYEDAFCVLLDGGMRTCCG